MDQSYDNMKNELTGWAENRNAVIVRTSVIGIVANKGVPVAVIILCIPVPQAPGSTETGKSAEFLGREIQFTFSGRSVGPVKIAGLIIPGCDGRIPGLSGVVIQGKGGIASATDVIDSVLPLLVPDLRNSLPCRSKKQRQEKACTNRIKFIQHLLE